MTTTDLRSELDVDPDEAFALRRGGVLALTPDRLYVVRDGEDGVRFDVEDVVSVKYDSMDWFLAVLSVALVGFGVYSTTQHVLGGIAFALAGVVSLYVTYRKRGKLSFQVSGRTDPLIVFPERPRRVYETLKDYLPE